MYIEKIEVVNDGDSLRVSFEGAGSENFSEILKMMKNHEEVVISPKVKSKFKANNEDVDDFNDFFNALIKSAKDEHIQNLKNRI